MLISALELHLNAMYPKHFLVESHEKNHDHDHDCDFQMFADSLSNRVELAEDSDIFICFLGSELERFVTA